MNTLRALIVGVSNYDRIHQINLPFCINDISAMREALVSGLNFNKLNIITCGENGIVTEIEFLTALKQMTSIADSNDTLVFYFSGHGGTSQSSHHLLLSDSYINTQVIIEYLEKIPAKNKIIFIDSCMSGDFNVSQTASYNINEAIKDFLGRGYAVFASSRDNQYSYGHPEKPLSLFTSFLCEVLQDVYLIQKGKKSLDDIKKLLFVYLDVWNKRNPERQQQPIYRANMGGTIFFDVQEYHPFHVAQIYEETDNYVIYSVKPLHHGLAKRYAVKVILKRPFSFEEISVINHEIVKKAKTFDIYENEITEKHWRGKDANLVFCYYGRDESDIVNGNYLCDTTWVDDAQDKAWWYRVEGSSSIINNVYVHFHSYYESLKIFNTNNCGTKDNLINESKIILVQLVTLAEQVIALYNEFLNKSKDEKMLVNELDNIIPVIERLFLEETNLSIPPIELHEWSQRCSYLAGTIYDLTLFYNKKNLESRTYENRMQCMNLKIRSYYEDLEELKKVEENI
ncbi:Caspase domain-containing protein [Propionispira arboris]|uniref:Caspase domain-containing protein n=1 Tax=Propionispira arboris TaxID=84035 RepID=A0A1H6ZXC5_9FIRM|nr:caspase family protein [Propionispira arboris]SEJ54240.1 Caspase domain-containing protein [Propionispira arboris]